MFDVAHPLPRGLPIHFSGINKVVWLELKYENLPDICFFCGRMGHSYNKGCMDYMKACDEAPFPPELRYDIKTIMGKVKVTTNTLLCHDQLNFTNPPVASFMTSNPASAVCVAPPENSPPFPTYGTLEQGPSHGLSQQVGLYKSGPTSYIQDPPPMVQLDAHTNPHTAIQTTGIQTETVNPSYTALLTATMSNSSVHKVSPTSNPSHTITPQNSSSSNSTSSKYCQVPLPDNLPVLDTSKKLEAMNLTYQPGLATPSGSKASRKRNKPDSKDKFKRQTEMINGELRHQIKRSRSDTPQANDDSTSMAGCAFEPACPPP
ncbi:hypothetical protein CsatB_028715 [Cannabis sativa]